MSAQRVLVIDDEPDIRELLEITLLRMGLDVKTAEDVKTGLLEIQNFKPDLCLTDMKLPDGTGFDVVHYIQREYSHIPVAVITAFGSMEAAVEALKAGAYDFVSKPVDINKLRDLIQTALKLSNKIEDDFQVSDKENKADSPKKVSILGGSSKMLTMKKTIVKLARSQAPVFIYGESGSGKELVAKQIHVQSPRVDGPFIPVNCGAIPESLMESEFFGHKKGSFTGAIEDKKGLFEAADHGTLFLDEVADLPIDMQVKLLRAIQEKATKPVGGVEEVNFDARILSATHKDLALEVEEGRFRQDLYYRLNVIKLDVPPLREREDDVELLAGFFLEKIAARWQLPIMELSENALNALKTYPFPGNVRELENILERACTLCDDDLITVEDLQLPENTSFSNTTQDIDEEEEDLSLLSEEERILKVLNAMRWNRTAAAKELGMTFRQLRYRIKKYNLDQQV